MSTQCEISSSSSKESIHSATSNISNIEQLSSCIQSIDSLNIKNAEENNGELESGDDSTSTISLDDDYSKNFEWLNREKHVFILSSAGKPIFSRYGNENKLATLFGVMQALVSFVQAQEESIECIQAGNTKFVFLIESHLILVAVSKSNESEHQLRLQLRYVFNQIISILTMTTLNKTYEKRRNFDLRRSLSGVERLLDHLLDFYEKNPAFILGAVQCLPLQQSVRDSIGSAITQACSKIKNVVFAVLLADDKLITLVRMKKYALHPSDLHLILNLVHASESLKTAESWTPLCLPQFREDGYLYSHVSYLAEDCQACLLLLTTDRDVFFTLSEAKQRIVEKLRRGNCLEAINESLQKPNEVCSATGFPEIRHYMYKSKATAQFCQPAIGAPYNLCPENLFALYRRTQGQLEGPGRPLKLVFERTPHEAILGWDTKEFELYVIFEPMIDSNSATAIVTRLLNWLKKREEKLFQFTPQFF